jgi:hypothetical protein
MPLIVVIRPNCQGRNLLEKIIIMELQHFLKIDYSKPTNFPLILIALPEYHNLFRKISRNPFLLKEGVMTNYNIFTVNELNNEMWKAVEHIRQKDDGNPVTLSHDILLG